MRSSDQMEDRGGGPASAGRRLSIRQAAFIGVASMVGAGIFSLLGAAGEVAGSAVWISFLLAGAVAVLQGYSFSKIGARYPSSGGLLEYVVRGYGNGHITGVIAWLVLAVNAIITAMVGGLVRQLRERRDRRRGPGVRDEGLRRAPDRRDVGPELVRLAGGRPVQSVVVVVVIGILSLFAVATLANADFALLARRAIRRSATSSGASR